MHGARYIFGLISVVLLGSAAGTYLGRRNDESSIALPVVLAVCGIVVGVIAWQFERLRKRPAPPYDGDDVGDIAFPRRDHHHDTVDIDADN